MNSSSLLTVQLDPGGVWLTAFSLVLAMAASLFVWDVCNRFKLGWVERLTWVPMAMYAVLWTTFPFAKPLFGVYTFPFQSSAGFALAAILLVPYMALLAPRYALEWVLLPVMVIFEIGCVWLHKPGLMVAPSFNTALVALCLPYIWWPLQIAGLLTIVTHHGSTALLIVAAELLAYAWMHKRLAWYVEGMALAGCLMLIFKPGDFMLGSHERLAAWGRYMHFWASNWRYITLGVGPGSFTWVSCLVDKFIPPLYLEMHCDILQILFEYGMVGFGLVAALWGKAVWKSRADAATLAGVLGTAAFGLSYHALHFAPTLVVIALIFRNALVVEKIELDLPR